MTISEQDLQEIYTKYNDLLNYESDDIYTPINPFSYRDLLGDTLLHIAVQRNDIHTVSILIDNGMDVNVRGDMNSTPLHYAANLSDRNLMNFLIERGANAALLDDFGNAAYEK